MNKFFIAAASTLALASCSSDDFLGEIQGNEQNGATSAINFGGDTGKITRASDPSTGSDAADLLENNFVVVGFKGSKTDAANNETYAFDHYNVNFNKDSKNSTESNRAGWEYVNQDMRVKGTEPYAPLAQSASQQAIKYWDHSCASYDFIAFSMGKKGAASKYATPTSVNKGDLAHAAYTLTGNVNTLSECYISDMKTVIRDDYGKTVSMSFRHLASKVRMALFETVPGYVISDVKFYTDATSTTTDNTEGTLIGTFNNSGTLTVSFPKTGTVHAGENDYNKAHVKFTASTTAGETGVLNHKGFGAVNYKNQAEGKISEGTTYLSQNAATPSYCGVDDPYHYYQNVLPSEGKPSAITLRIDYKLTSVDGSNETINVTGATATVPAEYTEWKSGYAYTYIFKISQNTNGSTGGTGTKPGLTAISFDAVVVDDEANGLQETITTVSDNSITTYGYKDNKVTTNGNEYVNGTDIYATVYVPAEGETAAAKTVAPQKLYTVTLEAGATQTINEASVANALVNGTNDATAKTWTVKDRNGMKMVVTETTGVATTVTEVPAGPGYTLKVNALKWTGVVTDPAKETYYVVEYDNGTKKSYKIVKVVKK